MASILLVEPDAAQGQVYKRSLQQAGHEVVTARTAARAVTLLDTSAIDVIILELNLAVHNGIELLYEVRSYSDWNNIRVIIYTTVRPKQLHAPALERLGVARVLYKPTTSLSDLQSAVDSVLQSVA